MSLGVEALHHLHRIRHVVQHVHVHVVQTDLVHDLWCHPAGGTNKGETWSLHFSRGWHVRGIIQPATHSKIYELGGFSLVKGNAFSVYMYMYKNAKRNGRSLITCNTLILLHCTCTCKFYYIVHVHVHSYECHQAPTVWV